MTTTIIRRVYITHDSKFPNFMDGVVFVREKNQTHSKMFDFPFVNGRQEVLYALKDFLRAGGKRTGEILHIKDNITVVTYEARYEE